MNAIGLVRGRPKSGITRYDYVNDRPYVASSFMSVALAKAFSTAMGGRSKERPELAAAPIPLEVEIAVLPCGAGGDEVLRRMFEPLGYTVATTAHPLDPAFPEWGEMLSIRRDAANIMRGRRGCPVLGGKGVEPFGFARDVEVVACVKGLAEDP